MDYRCRLGQLGDSSTASGSNDPRGTLEPCYGQAVVTYFFHSHCTSFHIFTLIFLLSSSLSLSYFILVVAMCKCLGKHSCMSSLFPIAILNGTYLVFSQNKMILDSVENLPVKNYYNYNNNDNYYYYSQKNMCHILLSCLMYRWTPPRELHNQWRNSRCRLGHQVIHPLHWGVMTIGGIKPELQLGCQGFFFCCTSFHTHSFLLAFFLCFFVLFHSCC